MSADERKRMRKSSGADADADGEQSRQQGDAGMHSVVHKGRAQAGCMATRCVVVLYLLYVQARRESPPWRDSVRGCRAESTSHGRAWAATLQRSVSARKGQ